MDAAHGDALDITNTFSQLEIERPSEGTNLEQRTQPSEVPLTLNEVVWQFKVVLEDYQRLQDALQVTWTGYFAEGLDLAAAAMTTNTAVKVARGIEEGILPPAEKYFHQVDHSHQALTEQLDLTLDKVQRPAEESNTYLGLIAVVHEEITSMLAPIANYLQLPDVGLCVRSYDSLGKAMTPAYTTLSAFHFHCTVRLDASEIFIKTEDDMNGKYQPEADREGMSCAEMWREHNTLVMGTLIEISILAKVAAEFPAVGAHSWSPTSL
ncbi:hypothetical protein DL769_004540 [Monosporascus sp. CRB-8-3]|nr:hypothetical protein DL769_004540 [Monosporascus sp. CRB-8-3]